MTSHKEEFRALMKQQLDELHRRVAELESLERHAHPPTHEHPISWNTVAEDWRRRHFATVERLHALEGHGEDSWHDVSEDIRSAVKALERVVEDHERKRKKKR